MSSVFVSNTNHSEDQPGHLTLKDPTVPIKINLERTDAPEQRYCPAGVWAKSCATPMAAVRDFESTHRTASTKTCDIKDPTQNIVWVAPEGGGGPNYPNM